MSRYGIIYKVTSPSKKIYIGQTVQKLRARQQYHVRMAFRKDSSVYHTKFSRAIRKYQDKLVWEILYDNIPSTELDALEQQTIIKYNSYNKGYNVTAGGYGRAGNPPSAKIRKKLSRKHTGKGNPFYGKKHSLETREKMSKSSAGQKAWNKGVAHTSEARKKMSLAQKRIADQKGKLTKEIVNQIRALYKSGRFTYQDLANQFGVTRGNIGHIIRKRIWK